MLPRMVHHLDEPIGDAAAINTFLICSAAREAGVKVLLSGMGADELFGGYRKHYAYLHGGAVPQAPAAMRDHAIRRRRLPAAGRRSATAVCAGRAGPSASSSFADLPEEAAFRRSYTIYDHDELADLLDPSLMSSVDRLFDEHAAIYASTRASTTP